MSFESSRRLCNRCSGTGILKEQFSQLLCNRTGGAAADHTTIHFDRANDLGGGSREKQLIGNIQIKPGQVFLDDLYPFLFGQSHYNLAGNAVQ